MARTLGLTDNPGYQWPVAQSGSGGDGTSTCRITVDGKVLVENTSQGPYAVVTCTEARG